jgi:hypothetical protein
LKLKIPAAQGYTLWKDIEEATMARRSVALLIICFVVVSPSLAQQAIPQTEEEAKVLTNHDVVDMLKAGLSPEIVNAKIKVSRCDFDSSPAVLKELKQEGVPDAVLIEMVRAPRASQQKAQMEEVTTAPTPAAEAERQNFRKCPDCKKLLLCYVDSQTGGITENWLTKNQWKFLKENSVAVASGKRGQQFWFIKQKENADFVVFWTRAVGFRPYVYYMPHAETETGRTSGSINGMVGSDYTWGNYSGTVQVTRTYYTQETGQWSYVDFSLTVYDAHTGKKVYETWHRGNFRWSKPDKDCLSDALDYLRSH